MLREEGAITATKVTPASHTCFGLSSTREFENETSKESQWYSQHQKCSVAHSGINGKHDYSHEQCREVAG